MIPIHNIMLGNKQCAENVSGEVRWEPKSGVTFRIEFPGICSTSVVAPLDATVEAVGTGKVIARTNHPNIVGEISDGRQVEIFGARAVPQATQTYGSAGTSQNTVLNGTAIFVRLRLSKGNDLALWHETVGSSRVFLHGFQPLLWPEQEEIKFVHQDGVTRTNRCSLTLCKRNSLRLFAAGPASGLSKCAWLVFECGDTDGGEPHIPCESERPFFSFLAGQRIPYLWWDRLIDDSELVRTYFGWQSVTDDENAMYSSQPLPLSGTIETIHIGKEVVEKLPRLYERYIRSISSFPVGWIMSPLWSTRQGVLDDMLAHACVSLERLADSFCDYQKDQVAKSPQPKFWTTQQSLKVRQAFNSSLNHVANKVGLNDKQISILRKRIDNLGQLPNADSLTAVFEHVGIKLSPKEIETISYRNRSLHGRRTLVDSNQINNVDAELQRFDTIRMLVHRALLGLFEYDGPYVDYASRPEKGNFEIKRLNYIHSPTD